MTPNEAATRGAHLDDACSADLVLGLLPDAERDAALAHAAECPACEGRLRSHAAAAARAQHDRPGAPRILALPKRRPFLAGRRGVIAAIVTLVAALPLALRGTHRAPVPASALPAPGEAVRTRQGTAEDPHLAAGLAAWAAHDPARAARELAQARGTGGAESMRRIYLADAEYACGHPREAVSQLRALDWALVPEPWRRDAAGLLARSLRASGEGATADSIERALRALAPGTPFVP
jgi:hypothetical protein